MKVCLVVCLALAHLAAGSIFNKKYQQQKKYQRPQSIESLDYVDPNSYYQQLNQQVRLYKEAQRSLNYGSAMDPETAEASSHEVADQIRVNIAEYPAPLYTEAQNWEVPQYVSQRINKPVKQIKIKKPVYGDAVVWKNIKMATGPRSPIENTKDIEMIFKQSYQTVKDFTEEEKKTFHDVYMTAAQNEDTQLNATGLLQKYQYPVEEHTVKTDDGYILTLFRIPPKQKTLDVQKRPVVFLMHGLLGSADDWLLMGPGKSLAYLLADADYDVWMGNARGSKYSRHHVSKNAGLPDFWQFSNDEIALHDLPAMIDYALNTSNQEKMYYVGFSEGTTAFFALASTRREYNDKIIMMYALSPMVYMSHTRSPLMKMIAPNSPFHERLHHNMGHGEFKPTPELIRTIGGDMLETKVGCKNLASNVYFVMAGMADNYDAHVVPLINSHLPAGASTRQIKQYGQSVATHEFKKYDYGPYINLKVYGSELPPKYEMSAVQVPVTLYYSEDDWLVHPTDVEQLRSELPQVKEAYKIPAMNFGNLDFQFSKVAPEAVYQRLIASIQNTQ